MRGLSLDQLQALIDVAELGSFSAAARRLNLTQPAISLQIRELERRVGVPLLERLGRRAFPTAAGRELIEHARRMKAEAERALAAMRRYENGAAGRVHIGTGVTALTYLLPDVLRRLRRSHPGIELVITTGTTQGVVERMLTNEVDLGFVTLPVDDTVFEAVPVRRDPLLALLPPHAKHVPSRVSAAHLAQYPLILEHDRANHSRIGRRWLQAAGFDGRPAMEIDNMEAIKQLVAAGLGASIVSSSALSGGSREKGCIARPLSPAAERTLAVIRRRDKPEDKALLIVHEALLSLRNFKERRSRTKSRPSTS